MASKGPRIPERVIDGPSQRLYILSLALVFQAVKLFTFFSSLIEGSSIKYFFQWMLYDTLFLLFLRFMRIPRLTFRWQSSLLQVVLLGMVNWLFFGNYTISFSTASIVPALVYNFWQRIRGDYVGINGYKVSITEIFRGDKHLIGQHTVRLSPISTAKLNPYGESFCIPSQVGHTFIPILFNNTEPSQITYSIAQLTDPQARTTHTAKKKDILSRLDAHQHVEAPLDDGAQVPLTDDEAFDLEFGEYDDSRSKQAAYQQQMATKEKQPLLQRTQRLRWIKINKPGVIKLESVQDGKAEVRLRTITSTVVHCPTAKFVGPEDSKARCRGDKKELTIQMFGVPPLRLEWQRELGGKREVTTVEATDPDRQGEEDQSLLAKELSIPLALTLESLGEHTYSLNSISDRLGNNVELRSVSPRNKVDLQRTISVLKPAEFSFQGCRNDQIVKLIQGRDTKLHILAGHHDPQDGPWKLSVRYTPSISDQHKGANGKNAPIHGWTKNFMTMEKHFSFPVEGPGDYTLMSAQGHICAGDVLSPETCKVVEIPLPRAEIEWKKLHECSGDVGVTANLILHGTPPFQVFYTTSHNGGQGSTNMTVINGSRGEITLQPERSGSYVYKFTSLSDANYKHVPLNGPEIKQTVHPLASAAFTGTSTRSTRGSKETNVESCSGDVVDVPVTLKGTAPWNLELQVVSASGTEKVHVPGIKTNQHAIKVKIPKEVDRNGGVMLVDLISVEDANGCKRSLTVPGTTINVRRVKPTVKFYAKDGKRQVQILMGETAHLPLRLTGEGPWTISYRHVDYPDRVKKERIRSANDHISVEEQGVYEILEVYDHQCPGLVLTPEHQYRVDWVPRPMAKVAPEDFLSRAKNGSYIRAPICVSKEDQLDLELVGSPPFQVAYTIGKDKERPEAHTFNSLQTKYRLPLQTSRSGHVFYQVTSVGDARYPLTERRTTNEPAWEQQVLARPTAYFKTSERLSYCLNDALVPRSDSHLNQDGVVVLEGKAPFLVHFTIQNLASSEVKKEVVEFTRNEWHLNFPDYKFSTVGSYLITIDSVRDASSCDEIVYEEGRRSVWVDVAETAMIVPYERRADVCVGDLLQFQLEGIAPWTITYRFNNKIQKTVQKLPKYTTVANVPGEFSVVSIAHQQAQCQTSVSDVRLQIHEIPSAQVHHGTRYEESIREGEQAEIVFTLIGEPPFTFTYQRAELAQYARGKKPKVMETHTVAGIMAHEYSIFSSAEGTWTVTFISDKWCRYPPAKIDPAIEAV